MTVAAAKRAARTAALARRRVAHETVDPVPAQAVLAGLLAAQPAGRAVALYAPVRSEIDPRPAVMDAVGRLQLAMPVVIGPGLPLVFRCWTPDAIMETGTFGVAIPAAGALVVPSLLIVPMLAFDRRGYRLGYGGGFYDRTLGHLRANAKDVIAIGFAFAAQGVDRLPVEATDQPLDAIVTERGLCRTGRHPA